MSGSLGWCDILFRWRRGLVLEGVVDVMNKNGYCNDGGKRFLGSRERRNFGPRYNCMCTLGERFGFYWRDSSKKVQ
jgi:hypothetical protein